VSSTLITGATGGLGRAVAACYARGGVTPLILPVRDARRGEALRLELQALGCPQVGTPVVDLASLSDVQRFIAECRTSEVRLQALVLNAGMQSARQLTFSGDGIESTFAVNHLAHYALLKGLLDHLTPEAMVSWTSSGTHDPHQRAARMFGFRGAQYHTAAMLAKGEYPGAKNSAQICRDAYATSKFCNNLMARYFGAAEPGRRIFFAFDPGLMPGTGLAREQHGIALAAWNHLLPNLIAVLPGASSPRRSGEVLFKLMQRMIIVAKNGSYFDLTGKSIAPYVPADEQAMMRDLIQTSDEFLARVRH
jgi:NAD(P)-dependent dehydrogenase (short-subunit alcohol dehydrogenase family)